MKLFYFIQHDRNLFRCCIVLLQNDSYLNRKYKILIKLTNSNSAEFIRLTRRQKRSGNLLDFIFFLFCYLFEEKNQITN